MAKKSIDAVKLAKRYTLRELSAGTGMSKNTLGDFIGGKRKMRAGNVTKLLAFLKKGNAKVGASRHP